MRGNSNYRLIFGYCLSQGIFMYSVKLIKYLRHKRTRLKRDKTPVNWVRTGRTFNNIISIIECNQKAKNASKKSNPCHHHPWEDMRGCHHGQADIWSKELRLTWDKAVVTFQQKTWLLWSGSWDESQRWSWCQTRDHQVVVSSQLVVEKINCQLFCRTNLSWII